MKTLLDLIDFTLSEDFRAQERIRKSPEAIKNGYIDVMRECPNLHRFLMEVNVKAGPDYARSLWFRIWAAIEDEREQGLKTTISILAKMPSLEDRSVEIQPLHHQSKVLKHCIEVLSELASSA